MHAILKDMNYSAILLAAGKGSRSQLSFNKVLYPWKDGVLLDLSLALFDQDPECTQVLLVCAANEYEEFSRRFGNGKVECIIGGKERQDSVFNGLAQVKEPYVLIHDGARPFASPALVNRIKEALEQYDAVVPGVEVVDTIKEVDEEGLCVRTLVRSRLRAIQTPQAFKTDLVCRALEKAIHEEFPVTDDAMAVELFYGVKAFCVPGEGANVKITLPEDVAWLEGYPSLPRSSE